MQNSSDSTPQTSTPTVNRPRIARTAPPVPRTGASATNRPSGGNSDDLPRAPVVRSKFRREVSDAKSPANWLRAYLEQPPQVTFFWLNAAPARRQSILFGIGTTTRKRSLQPDDFRWVQETKLAVLTNFRAICGHWQLGIRRVNICTLPAIEVAATTRSARTDGHQ
jgi:hypothetical protein